MAGRPKRRARLAAGLPAPTGNGYGQGGPARGYSWSAFEEGNAVGRKHGAYARLELSEHAGETSEILRELLPVYQESDEPLLQAFSFVLEQLKAAAGALEQAAQREERLRLSQDARGWTLAALRYAEHFAMTPRARTALGLDLVRGEATRLTVTRLARLAEEES